MLHELPLQTLNDRLKKFPFVDPQPFDELLAEIVDAIGAWLRRVLEPSWVTSCIEGLARLAGSPDAEDEAELFSRFEYQMPLKLRELQSMMRPFMEVQTSHHVDGVDAIASELVRSLLQIHHIIEIWDRMLTSQFLAVLHSGFGVRDAQGRVAALAALCATVEMSAFEVAHHLSRVSTETFTVSPKEIEAVNAQLPDLEQQRVFRGPPTLVLEHGVRPVDAIQGPEAVPGLMEARTEALQWWYNQGFDSGAPTRILSAALLKQLVDCQLHPDPWVAEMVPRTLERIYGVYMSCDTFMNRLLLQFGGYTSGNKVEVPRGQGLPLLSDLGRVAESLLVFLRHWDASIEAADQEELQRNAIAKSFKKQSAKRASKFNMTTYLENMKESGHGVNEVVDLLEGAEPIPDHILRAPSDGRRYRVDEDMERRWEFLTESGQETVERLQKHDRDLGPFVHFDTQDEGELTRVWEGLWREDAYCLTNPDTLRAAKANYMITDDSDSEEDDGEVRLLEQDDVSDYFALSLVDAPPELDQSALVSFLRRQEMMTSRRCLQGLPALPWCLGSDSRNTLVLDGNAQGVRRFQCILKKSKRQAQRVSLVPVDSRAKSFIVLPKYQRLQVRDGDWLVCHGWSCEVQLEPDFETNTSKLVLLTQDGTRFEAPPEGCHVGAGAASLRQPMQPAFPAAKLVVDDPSHDIAQVHLAFCYDQPMNRWTVVDHSPHPQGGLLALKAGVAYPLSRGLRLLFGPMLLQCELDTEGWRNET